VTTPGRPSDRAREGHGQHPHIHSLVNDPDERHADHLGLDAVLRAVELPGDARPRERPDGFQELLWFMTDQRCYLRRWHPWTARRARSSRVYPASDLAGPRAPHIPSGDNDVLVSATTATPTQTRTSFSASLGTTKDARKIGKNLFPVHRKATISPSATSKV